MNYGEKYVELKRRYSEVESPENPLREFFDNDKDFDIKAEPVTDVGGDYFRVGCKRMMFFDGSIWFMDYGIAKNITENRYYNFESVVRRIEETMASGGVCLEIEDDSASVLYNAMKRKDFTEHTCTKDEMRRLQNRFDNGTIILCSGVKFEYEPIKNRWVSDGGSVDGGFFIGRKISVLRVSSDVNKIGFEEFYCRFVTHYHFVEQDEGVTLNTIEDFFSAFNYFFKKRLFEYSFPCPTVYADAVEYRPSPNGKLLTIDNVELDMDTLRGKFVKLSASKTLIDYLVAKKTDDLSKATTGKSIGAVSKWLFQMKRKTFTECYLYDKEFEKYVVTERARNFMRTSSADKQFRKLIESSVEYTDGMEFDKMMRPITGRWWKALPKEEKVAMFNYTAGSGHVNRVIRGDDYGKMTEESLTDIKYMISALEKSKLNQTLTFVRGITIGGFCRMFNLPDELRETINPYTFDISIIKGLVAKDEAFTSCGCTESASFDFPVKMRVVCPVGTMGAYLEPFSYYGADKHGGGNRMNGINWDNLDGVSTAPRVGFEQEFLLQAGTTFKLEDVSYTERGIAATLVVINQTPPTMRQILDKYIDNSEKG